jgi:hypothetical protein
LSRFIITAISIHEKPFKSRKPRGQAGLSNAVIFSLQRMHEKFENKEQAAAFSKRRTFCQRNPLTRKILRFVVKGLTFLQLKFKILDKEIKQGGETVEIFEVFKYLSFIIFVMLVSLSIVGKHRYGFFLGAIIALIINFWTRAKLGESPNILEYLAAMAIYVLCMIVTIKLKSRKKTKPMISRGSYDEGWG